MTQTNLYEGYLRDHVPEIVKRYKRGETARAIAESIHGRYFPNKWVSDLEPAIKYVLRRTGHMPATVKPTLPPANVPDGMTAIEWLKRENRDEWPQGALARMFTFAENDRATYPTVGALRKATDRELLRLPNFGKTTLTAMRQRLGVTRETAPYHHLDIDAAIFEIREMRHHLNRIEQWLLGAHYSLTRDDDGVVDGSPAPDGTEPG